MINLIETIARNLDLSFIYGDAFQANTFSDYITNDFLCLDHKYTYTVWQPYENHRTYNVSLFIGGNSSLDLNPIDRQTRREEYESLMDKFIRELNKSEQVVQNIVQTGTLQFQENWLDSNKDVVFQTLQFNLATPTNYC